MPSSARSLNASLLALAAALIPLKAGTAADSGIHSARDFRLDVAAPEAFRLPGTPSTGDPASGRAIPLHLAGKPFAALIENAARDTALDPALVHAVIHVESRYNPAARSPKGALGLMQVLPATASRYGVTDAGRSPEANVRAGTRYLRDLMEQFDGRLDLVLAAYNSGENTVLRYGARIPPYRETRLYVPAVLAKYRELREARPADWAPVEYLRGTRLDLDARRSGDDR